jgi:hypothetical protein
MKSGPCPSERPSAWLVIAWANSCNTHHDGVRSASRIDSRFARATVVVACRDSGATAGG